MSKFKEIILERTPSFGVLLELNYKLIVTLNDKPMEYTYEKDRFIVDN